MRFNKFSVQLYPGRFHRLSGWLYPVRFDKLSDREVEAPPDRSLSLSKRPLPYNHGDRDVESLLDGLLWFDKLTNLSKHWRVDVWGTDEKNRSEVRTRLRLILFNTYEITIESVFGL